MSNISEANLTQLLPYGDGRRKSFEELVYQLVYFKYRQEIEAGKYKITAIDDSGGGSGVEFYLTKDTGKIIGWQVKAFGRIESSQRQQIKTSLAASYLKHRDVLEEWVLCTYKNLTPGDNGEQTWFDDNLQSMKIEGKVILPSNHKVKLTHWGDSALLAMLSQFPHIQNYFFNDKTLTPEWFSSQLSRYSNDRRIATKYIEDVHVDADEDGQLAQILNDREFQKIYDDAISLFEIRQNCKAFNEGYAKLLATVLPDQDHEAYRQAILRIAVPEKQSVAQLVLDSLDLMCELVVKGQGKSGQYKRLYEQAKKQYLAYDEIIQKIDVIYRNEVGTRLTDLQFDTSTDFTNWSEEQKRLEQLRRIRTRDLLGFYNVRLDAYLNIFRCFQSVSVNELHISATAGYGKTHMAFHTYKTAIESERPALFLLARELASIDEIPIKVSAPDGWSLDTLLGSLDVAARVAGKIAPIIIDGLNESQDPHSIWYDGIPRLIALLSLYPNLVLITTYRPTYTTLIFDDDYFNNNDAHPFNYPFSRRMSFRWADRRVSEELLEKYFRYYKIIIESGYLPEELFIHPLYLKIFCETKNHSRASSVTIPNIHRGDIYKVFEEYLKQCTNRIFHSIPNTPYDKDTILGKLSDPFGIKLWDLSSRSIPIRDVGLDNNLIRAFESEDLLVFRDYSQKSSTEEISFTYDMIAGYIIAQTLISMVDDLSDLKSLVQSQDFEVRILNEKTRHPLYEDILKALCVICLEREDLNTFLFEIIKDSPAIDEACFETLFYVDPKYLRLKPTLVQTFINAHTNTLARQNNFLGLSEPHWFDGSHPLNFTFVSDWLGSLDMASRDMCWTEHIRSNYDYFEDEVNTNYISVRSDKELHQTDLKMLATAWLLTTTIRTLRDKCTRLLYWYGRRNPSSFLSLLKRMLNYGDIYTTERVLAAAYGIAMASLGLRGENNNQVLDEALSDLAQTLYDLFFSKNATNPTTHALIRDYAKQTIDIALIKEPALLSESEKALTQYPLSKYPHKRWLEASDEQIEYLKKGAHPVRMDFDIYTIGHLISARSSHDGDTQLAKKIRSEILWRIIDLGFDAAIFESLDYIISRDYGNSHLYSGDKTGKIDRYGKKYSWIAYFEMAGRLSDDGILVNYDGTPTSRLADIGIDPSFPEMPKSDFYQLLGNSSLVSGQDADKWVENESDLGIEKYLISDQVDGADEWVLLSARIVHEDAEDQTRDAMVDIAAVLVDDEAESKLKAAMQGDDNFRMGMVDGARAFYTFDGELPWSDNMPPTTKEELVVEYGTKFDVTDRFSVTVEPLFYVSNWESYHSALNNRGETVSPSREFLRTFDLNLVPQTSNFCDANGIIKSRTLNSTLAPYGSAQFTYVRKKDITKFIGNKKLVWSTWREKRWWKHGLSKSTLSENRNDTKIVEFCRFDFLSDLL